MTRPDIRIVLVFIFSAALGVYVIEHVAPAKGHAQNYPALQNNKPVYNAKD